MHQFWNIGFTIINPRCLFWQNWSHLLTGSSAWIAWTSAREAISLTPSQWRWISSSSPSSVSPLPPSVSSSLWQWAKAQNWAVIRAVSDSCDQFIQRLSGVKSWAKDRTKRSAGFLLRCQDGWGKFDALAREVKELGDLLPVRVSQSQQVFSTVLGITLYPVEEVLSAPPAELQNFIFLRRANLSNQILPQEKRQVYHLNCNKGNEGLLLGSKCWQLII